MAYSCLDTFKTLDKTISSLDMQLAVARASEVKNNEGDLGVAPGKTFSE